VLWREYKPGSHGSSPDISWRGEAATEVAQTGSLPCRGLAIRRVFEDPTFCRLPVGDTAGYQPALQKNGSWKMCANEQNFRG
jgi:hypothetical protein